MTDVEWWYSRFSARTAEQLNSLVAEMLANDRLRMSFISSPDAVS